jgi:hypothetical protein
MDSGVPRGTCARIGVPGAIGLVSRWLLDHVGRTGIKVSMRGKFMKKLTFYFSGELV